MEAKANYTLVGLTVLILLTGLLSAGLWLSTGFDKKKYKTYTVYMHEAISGLGEDALVKYNGVKVGYVQDIELTAADPQQVKLQLKIEEHTPITTSTRATLISQGITGTTYLGLSSMSSTLTPLGKTPGEPYPVIPYQASFLNQLEKNVNQLSLGLSRLLTEENAKNLHDALSNVEKATHVIADNDKNLNRSLQELPKVINELQSGIKKFNLMAEHLAEAGQQISVTMKAGKSSIDQFSQQTLPPAEQLMQRLDVIAANLEDVTTQMRHNPSVIVRGSVPPKPGPGES